MALQLIPRRRILPNPSLNHLFSTTSNSDDRNDQSKPSSSSSSSTSDSLSSYFSDVKASLRRQHQFTPPSPPRSPTGPSSPNHPSSPPSKVAPLEEIRKYLSEFRRLSAPDSGPTPSFQDLYRRNALENAWNSNPEKPAGGGGGRPSLGAIRESLRQMKLSESARTDGGGKDPLSLSAFKSSLRLKPMDSPPSPLPPRTTVIGGTEALPLSLFGKEMKERKDGDGSSAMKTEFVKMHSHEELGEKLKKLRPEGKGEGWFSMEELNERLMRLREMEEKERESITHGLPFKELRESLENLKISSDNEKGRKTSIARLGVLGLLGQTPSYMMQPPKEHLVEKYFHPDNMSSAEKMKLELAKVRDEFKMSESDCGSARVQVAQLTTKIKRLSTVLHKKDKHSRKGLVAMVQRRKRLLKYLRRTDWDSYCFVLDKLGLRDNPDYKN